MTDELLARCLFAGANSIFIGDTLRDRDANLLDRLGIASSLA